MCNRYFGCLLLVWFPAVLHAQSETQSCNAPELLGGVFAPRQRTYTSGTVVTYICNEGLKPAVKGRLATITCENGKWSHRAQCIDVKACIPPSIPNGHYTENSNGWYEEGYTMRTECDQGYEHRDSLAVTRCVAGEWTSLPICEKSATACSQPPTFPHALMFDHGYKEVFPANTEVLYVCEDGYAAEGGHPATPVLCIDGDWTEGPTCSKESISVSKCGTHPTIEHGDIVEVDAMFLRIQCNASYNLVGPEKVVCYTDGTWSQLPICQDTRCLVDTTEYPDLVSDGVKHMRDGDKMQLRCVKKHWYWVTDHYSSAECIQGRVILSECRGFAGRKLEEFKVELEGAFSD